MNQATFYEPARAGKIGQFCPIRRCAFADEMARVVLFLESDKGQLSDRIGMSCLWRIEFGSAV
jgi:hypothetical protein